MALSTLVVDLILRAGGFESDMGRASKTAKKRMKEIEDSAKKMGAVLGTALAAAGTAAAFAIKNAIDRADEINEASQKTGVAAETLSAYGYAARQAGVEFDALTTALGRLAKYQVEAATGNEEALRTFQAFGVEIKDAGGKLRDVGDVFRDWSQVFSEMEDGPLKTAKAIEILGKSGADLIPMMNEGADGLDRLVARARELGIVIDDETASAADAFNDRVDDLQTAVSGLAMAVAADLLPDLTALADEFINGYTKGDKLAETSNEVADAFRLAADTAGTLWNAFQFVANSVDHLLSRLLQLSTYTPPGWMANLASGGALREISGQRANDAIDAAMRNADELEAFASGQWRVGNSTPGMAAGGGDQFDRNGREVILAGEGFGKGTGGSRAKKGLSEAEQAAKRLSEAYERLRDQQLEQIALFGQEGEAAQVRYDIEHGELKDLSEAKKQELLLNAERIDTMEAEAKVKEELARIDEERREALDDYFADLEFEAELIGKSNAERAAEIELRRIGIDLTTQEGQALKENAVARYEAMEAAQDQIENADRFRDHWEDAFAGILDGTKSVKEAFNDLANSILSDIARMIAKQWVEKLFGAPGTTLGGASGAGGFLSWITGGYAKGAAFANGNVTAFAGGGIVDRPTLFPMARGMGLMAEAGPEAIMPLARDAQGRLGVRGGGMQQTNNFLLQGRPEQKTQDQMAQRAGRSARRAMARLD